jgi:hypothetical protein
LPGCLGSIAHLLHRSGQHGILNPGGQPELVEGLTGVRRGGEDGPLDAVIDRQHDHRHRHRDRGQGQGPLRVPRRVLGRSRQLIH